MPTPLVENGSGSPVCAAALIRSLRARQLTWVVVLVATAALPLLATAAAFAYALLVPEQFLKDAGDLGLQKMGQNAPACKQGMNGLCA